MYSIIANVCIYEKKLRCGFYALTHFKPIYTIKFNCKYTIYVYNVENSVTLNMEGKFVPVSGQGYLVSYF